MCECVHVQVGGGGRGGEGVGGDGSVHGGCTSSWFYSTKEHHDRRALNSNMQEGSADLRLTNYN